MLCRQYWTSACGFGFAFATMTINELPLIRYTIPPPIGNVSFIEFNKFIFNSDCTK